MKRKKVSVIIPSYNHEKFIAKTIESVLNQTFSDFELLIADDCSTDFSKKIISSYEDSRIKTYYFKKNVGTVATINFLLSQSTGEYIATLGSDDVWVNEKLAKQVDFLENNPTISAVFSWATIVDENEKPLKNSETIFLEVFNEANRSRGEWLRFFFERGNHLCHSSVLLRNEIGSLIGNYNPVFRQLHDLDYWIRLINQYDIHIINEPLVLYRRVEKFRNSVSAQTPENSYRLFNEYNYIFQNLFEIIDDNVFVQGFSDLFINKNVSGKSEIICEKYFILKQFKLYVNNLQLSANYIMKHMNDDTLQCFLNKYDFDIIKFYKHSGKMFELYPSDYYALEKKNEILRLSQTLYDKEKEIALLYNSKSWKLTRPIRKISSILKKLLRRI